MATVFPSQSPTHSGVRPTSHCSQRRALKLKSLNLAVKVPLSSLHAISLFATLSARDRIREGLNSAPALADNKIETSIAIYDAGYLRTSCSRS